MLIVDVIISGLVLGGLYALIALGLNLQYGVARIMNLSYGEVMVAGAFAALVATVGGGLNPFIALALAAPAAFITSFAIYRVLLMPLVQRAASPGQLEADSILATFGILFVIQGILLVMFGGQYQSYGFLATPVSILGTTQSLNKLVALGFALGLGGGLYLVMMHTRMGAALRAVAINPASAQLVGIDPTLASAIAFGIGGALTAGAGVLLSMFLTFNAAIGVMFTMKALIVVIMGGVGNLLGGLVAGLLLGLTESIVATYADPGLTLASNYALFLLVLLIRPAGLFGKPVR